MFFLSPDDKVYARYGQRDARGPDELQSLKGLRHAMQSVLDMHAGERKAAPSREGQVTIREAAGRRRGCYHCHQVNEFFNKVLVGAGRWSRDKAYRFPLPDNLGVTLEVDRGNVVQGVAPESPGAKLGLAKGDRLRQIGAVPVHSIADAQLALDRAPAAGEVPVAWDRGGKNLVGTLSLPEGWRKSDITWRPSLRRLLPSLPLRGANLTEAEKAALGLGPRQLGFRQRAEVNAQAKAAGVLPGDVIVGIDGKEPVGMDADGFRDFVRREYLVGDTVKLQVLRDGKRLSLPLTLR